MLPGCYLNPVSYDHLVNRPESNIKAKDIIMAKYVSLIRFTPQGVRNLKQSPARAAAFCKTAEKAGVKVETQLWTTGAYDGILVLSAADEKQVLNVITKLVAGGNVSTQTLQASDAKEFAAIVRG